MSDDILIMVKYKKICLDYYFNNLAFINKI